MANDYNYPTKDQIPYPAVSGMSNREYERYRILQENQRRRSGEWGSNYFTNLDVALSRPLDTLLSEFGLANSDKWYAGGGVVDFLDQVNPLSAGYRIGDELIQGNFRNAAAEGLNVFAGKIPLFSNPATRTAGKKLVATVGKALAGYGLTKGAEKIQTTDQNDVPFTKEPLLPQPRDMSMTAEEYAKMVEANKNRTDAQGRSGMGATSVLPGRPRPEFDTFEPPAALPPGTSIATIPPPAQLPLTPDQMDYYGEEMSGINKLYQQTLADIAKDQEQGQLGYARIGQAAQRRAAGSAQDVANQIAGSTVGGSPAAAFGAEQMVQAPLVQQRQTNRLNLDQLLSQLQKQKTQAGTTMDTSKLNLRRWEAMQRAANTSGQVQAGYQNSLGGM